MNQAIPVVFKVAMAAMNIICVLVWNLLSAAIIRVYVK